jgi:NADH-quinone oxidoreductase subunit E
VTTSTNGVLSETGLAKARELIARYPEPRSALLPLLFLVQAEQGYVSPAGIAEVAGLLGLTRAQVGAVATFYTMFHRRPAGKYVVSVCRTLSCAMRGSEEVTDAICERLGVERGGTTPDGKVTVEEVECLAACDGGAVLQVNYENYERVTPQDAVGIVEALLRDEVPAPTFAAEGSVTEPSSAAAYWRLTGLGEPPAALVGQAAVDGAAAASARPGGAAEPEAEAAQPHREEPAAAQPAGVADEAGQHQREQPGGEPQ